MSLESKKKVAIGVVGGIALLAGTVLLAQYVGRPGQQYSASQPGSCPLLASPKADEPAVPSACSSDKDPADCCKTTGVLCCALEGGCDQAASCCSLDAGSCAAVPAESVMALQAATTAETDAQPGCCATQPVAGCCAQTSETDCPTYDQTCETESCCGAQGTAQE